MSVCAPTKQLVQVRKRLYKGDELHADGGGIFVDLTKLLHGIATALIAEIRLVFNLIGVLGVKHENVVAHFRNGVYEAL